MIFVVKVQLKKISAPFLSLFLITKTPFLLTIGYFNLKCNKLSLYFP